MKPLRSIAFPLVLSLAFTTVAFAQTANNPPSSSQKSDSDQPVSDTWITTKVKSELATTEGVKSLDISVKTVNGVVTLTGTQPNDLAVKKAVATAQSVKGVNSVDSSGLKVKASTDRTGQ